MKDQLSLFNAMDGNLLDVGKESFAQSLAMNVLFQEKILISDTMFFNSQNLANHLNEQTNSLFEAACTEGIVVPALKAAETLGDAYRSFSTFYGPTYDVGVPEMQEALRKRVILAVDTGIDQGHSKAFLWPQGQIPVGVTYLQIIQRLLQTEKPPTYVKHNRDRSQLFDRMWEKTKRWRFDLVEAAAKRTSENGNPGLQRAELFILLSQQVGANGTAGKDIADAPGDPENRLAASLFVKWATQCYHVNQASRFGVSINFPAYNLDHDFVMDSILRSPLDKAPESSSGFRCGVLLPSFEKLAQAKPDDLLAIRREHGKRYRYAMKHWYEQPSEGSEDDVKVSLREYCAQIQRSYEKIAVKPLDVSFSIGDVVPTVAGLIVNPHAPHLHQIFTAAAGKIAKTAYQMADHNRIKAQYKGCSQQIEITLANDVAKI